MSTPSAEPGIVVVTGANGLVGTAACRALLARGVTVRGIVRTAGSAPTGVQEVVGDFRDTHVSRSALQDAAALVTTVHPMGGDRVSQHEIGVRGTAAIARVAAEAGVARLVHVSTAAVYDRSPQAADIDESAALIGDDAGDYPVTKRDTEAALADVTGITRVLLRPPAILGAGASSVWNTLRPNMMRDDEAARHAKSEQTWPWVHVDDLAEIIAMVATGEVADAGDAAAGPVAGECVAVNVASGPATMRDYVGTVTRAVGVEPVWDDGDAWTGRIVTDRAAAWGWTPTVGLGAALAEIERSASA